MDDDLGLIKPCENVQQQLQRMSHEQKVLIAASRVTDNKSD